MGRLMRFSAIRKYDFQFHIVFTIISTLVGIFSVFLVNRSFGGLKFADFALSGINIQIILALSDLGVKYSFFKDNSTLSLLKNFKYLIIIRAFFAVLLFLASLLFYYSDVYLAHFFSLIGFTFFPNLLFQKYRLFTIISLNNVIYRSLPLLIIYFINSLEIFVMISGLFLILTSCVANIILGVFSRNSFRFLEFKSVCFKLFKDNRFLGAISLINIFEVYIHVFFAKIFLNPTVFAELIYVERYTNYFKQGVVYLYEFLYPKITLINAKLYQVYARLLALVLIVFIFFIFLLNYLFKWVFVESDASILFFAMLSIPVIIILVNFVQSIIYFKYCSDRRGFAIVVCAVFLKVILMFIFIQFFDSLAIPIGLLSAEVYMGIRRSLKAEQQLKVKIRIL
jgi:hypothetical protein